MWSYVGRRESMLVSVRMWEDVRVCELVWSYVGRRESMLVSVRMWEDLRVC